MAWGLILDDRPYVETELYNLRSCSFINIGQRTNEVSLRSVSLLFISSWRKNGTLDFVHYTRLIKQSLFPKQNILDMFV